MNTQTLLKSLLALLYPNLCLACRVNPPTKKDIICLTCQYYLPKTNFHLKKENVFTERFWGRVPIHAAAALFYFQKNGKVQNLIHELKYQDKPQIGIQLGKYYGKQLQSSPHFQSIDLIIPIPLHPKKQHKRGYNQSDMFAKGLAESMQKKWKKDILWRGKDTSSQTNKSRIERITNVEDAFYIKNKKEISNKHILLVDDVITTGATLEVCALLLLSCEGVKISLATIAIASH